MAVVHVSRETSLPPNVVLEGARDFSDRRADLWPDVHLEHFEVHTLGDTHADVTEGNPEFFGYIWERLLYDWSHPTMVRGTVVDSNIFRPGSTWELRAIPLEDGGSQVHITGVRHPRGPKGAIIWLFIKTGAGRTTVDDHLRHFLAQIDRAGP